ncbi:Ig-like domain-containing protein [Neobacillus sp. YIM B06451]|uniref:Ig-like domain-containing protein n=1 Tax=Neobacillus sp. YIM B06451 TaxID=3070994 RepID=UPI002931C1A5|nr:Ig-like domain-containing protein [Neobacillus sp. YIM B06451]
MKQIGLATHIRIMLSVALAVYINFNFLSTINYHPAKAAESSNPTIFITSPKNGDTVTSNPFIFTGTVSNFNSLNNVTIELFEESRVLGTAAPESDGKWSYSVSLRNGTHTITAKALDTLGNSAISDPVNISVNTEINPVTVIEPASNGYINRSSFSGFTNPNYTVHLCIRCTKNEDNEILGNWKTAVANETGFWIIEIPDQTEGLQTAYVKASDPAGNESTVSEITYTFDKSRPIILPNVYPKNDMTHVPLNTEIKIQLFDESPIAKSSVKDQAITLSQNGTKVLIEANPNYDSETKTITFKPTADLEPGKKYIVNINQGISDTAGNYARPRSWSFTTISDPALLEENPFGENPHGTYQENVNTCSNCHSTHTAENPKLLSQAIGVDGQNISNYCNACHDGTVGAPLPENSMKSHAHDYGVSIDGMPTSNSCASCHNPHLEWSEENPNLLQDHFTYDHPNDKQIPSSSKEQLCESCHETDSLARKIDPRTNYRIFKYNKWNTALGIYEDYQLCLRCHNQNFKEKYENMPDIAQFYNNLTENIKMQYEKTEKTAYNQREITLEEKSFSGHIIKAEDGSPLAGHIPCADCHDTHGSDNIKQLKKSIGHENPTAFNKSDGEWSESLEREFCLACHNGSTILYGITVKAPTPELSPAHIDVNSVCSSCHGGSSNSFMEAIHAPKRNKPNQ